MKPALKYAVLILVLSVAWQSNGFAANTSGDEFVVRFTGNYTRSNPARPVLNLANVMAMNVSSPNDNSAKAANVFMAARDLVIDRVIYKQWNLPAKANDPTLTNDGDLCLYARTQGIDPGPSELFCFSTYTTRPYPGVSEEGTPNGMTREIVFPRNAGLFFPKNTSVTCPGQMHRTIGGLYSPEQKEAARWSCTIEYHVASSTEVVSRIARIPYLDTSVKPDETEGNLINNKVAWYKGWEGPAHPLVIRGFMVYAGVLGLNPRHSSQRHYQNICLTKLSKDGAAEQKGCANNFTYNSNDNAPSEQYLPGVVQLRNPMILNNNERLAASCQTTDKVVSDCALFVLYEVSPEKRIPSVADYYWDIGHVNTSLLKQNGFYCSPENMRQFNPAGNDALSTIASIHAGPWAGDNCADNHLICGCHSLFKSFPH